MRLTASIRQREGRGSRENDDAERFDLSVIRNVPLRDKRFQLRFEVFNLFNRTNFFNPGTSLGTAQFGRISQAADGRSISSAPGSPSDPCSGCEQEIRS